MRLKRADYQRGHFYHIYNRGAHRHSIFRESDNYFFVIDKMKIYSRLYQSTFIAYCLLPNHYHFLLRQDKENPASLIPQYTFNSYSKAYNNKYHHSGTLFEGNFQAKSVDSTEYLLHLCRYIHANPLRHGLARSLEDWPYSNYHEWLQTRDGNLVDQSFIATFFPDRREYARTVIEYAYGQKTWPDDLAF